jgi:hypothetical protein
MVNFDFCVIDSYRFVVSSANSIVRYPIPPAAADSTFERVLYEDPFAFSQFAASSLQAALGLASAAGAGASVVPLPPSVVADVLVFVPSTSALPPTEAAALMERELLASETLANGGDGIIDRALERYGASAAARLLSTREELPAPPPPGPATAAATGAATLSGYTADTFGEAERMHPTLTVTRSDPFTRQSFPLHSPTLHIGSYVRVWKRLAEAGTPPNRNTGGKMAAPGMEESMDSETQGALPTPHTPP